MFYCVFIESYTWDSDLRFTKISAHLSDRNLKATCPCTAGVPRMILLWTDPHMDSVKTPLPRCAHGAPSV